MCIYIYIYIEVSVVGVSNVCVSAACSCLDHLQSGAVLRSVPGPLGHGGHHRYYTQVSNISGIHHQVSVWGRHLIGLPKPYIYLYIYILSSLCIRKHNITRCHFLDVYQLWVTTCKQTYSEIRVNTITHFSPFLVSLSSSPYLPLGAVVIRSADVWPMVRIYRGGFLLIEFLFLLGKHTHAHTHIHTHTWDIMLSWELS